MLCLFSVVAALISGLLLSAGATHAAAATAGSRVSAGTTADVGPDWTVYHGNVAGTGVAAGLTSVDVSAPRWTSPQLDGQLYGQPLVFDGRVYVATEDDSVYALSAVTGAVIWRSHLATPIPSSELPCGDISPALGITGTPVIDAARDEIFVVADELVAGTPAHILVALSTTSGATELRQDVDPANENTGAVLQRTGLTLDAGRVIFAVGGNDGDCASYRGRVISVPETGGAPAYFTVDAAANDSQGAIWMGGAAPVVDSAGQVLVAVGNGSVDNASAGYDDSDSVLALSPTMTLLSYFAPADWPENNAHDADMSVAPALLGDGQVVLSGKSRIAYALASPTHLGGIGGQQAELGDLCAQDIDGGVAINGQTVYLPCLTGPVAVQVDSSPPALHELWSAHTGGGPPVLAAGLVWTISQGGMIYGLNPANGVVRELARVGTPANHFPTAGFGAGLLLAPAAHDVVAFATTATATAPPATATTKAPPATASSPSPSNATSPLPQSSPPASSAAPTSPAVSTSAPAVLVLAGQHKAHTARHWITAAIVLALLAAAAGGVAWRRRVGHADD